LHSPFPPLIISPLHRAEQEEEERLRHELMTDQQKRTASIAREQKDAVVRFNA
jgi:hypothetical protein